MYHVIKGQEATCSIVIKETARIHTNIHYYVEEKSSHFQLVYELIKRNQNPIFYFVRYGHLNILIWQKRVLVFIS